MIRLNLRARAAFLADDRGVAFDVALFLHDDAPLFAADVLLLETALPLPLQNHVGVPATRTLVRVCGRSGMPDDGAPLFTRGWCLWSGHELVPERTPGSDRRVSAYRVDRNASAPSRKPDPSCRRSSSSPRCRLG